MQKILRILIIVAMLITSYLLVLAWRDDYITGGKPQPPTATAPTAVSDVPAGRGTANPTSDVPTASNAPITSTQTSGSAQQLIEVQTDKYDIRINPMGGDVVYAALRDEAATLDNAQPFVLLQDDSNRVYVAQSGLVGRDGIDGGTTRAPYSTPRYRYQMGAQDKTLVVPLTYQKDGVTISKTYTFTQGQYPIQVAYNINNTSRQTWQGQMYAQLKRDNSKDPGLADKGAISMATYLGGAWGTPEKPYNKLKFSNFDENRLNVTTQQGWVAIVQHYFLSAWVPHGYSANFYTRSVGNDHIIGLMSSPVEVAPAKQLTLTTTLYAGPKDTHVLRPIAEGLDKTVDYGVLWPISKFLFWVLESLYKVIGNWGWSIIALTLLVKLALLPISNKSYYSMAKMRAIAPRLQALKEEYGDDRMRMSQEMMRIYKEEQVNPLAGCLPVFMQMPIFLALYWVLVESVQLRHAPWIGWIHDLSSMDPYFILPLCMGLAMFVQQSLNPQPTDPMQARVMKFMPIIFTAFMLFFPAGLVLYWTVNNLFSMVQQYLINKQVDKQQAAKDAARHVV